MKKIRIAIDGPASAGKSTIAKELAKKMNYIYCDTGAMYRALTLAAIRNNISSTDEIGLVKLLNQVEIIFKQTPAGQSVYLNGEEITLAIRENQVTNQVSEVAAHQLVREELVKRQQKIAEVGGIVMDGRDIGTTVMPDAEIKIFLIASVEERAQRRFLENKEKGIDANLADITSAIEKRDYLDSHRQISPLIQAKDAVLVDSTGLTIPEVVQCIIGLIAKRGFC